MRFTIRGLRGLAGQEWARALWFGQDHKEQHDPVLLRQQLVSIVRDFIDNLQMTASAMVNEPSDAGSFQELLDGGVTALRNRVDVLESALESTGSGDLDRPFRVVLMGQTMSG